MILVEHAIRILRIIDLTNEPEDYIPGKYIASELGLSKGTVDFVACHLRRQGIIHGRTGPNGGFKRLRKTTLGELYDLIYGIRGGNSPAVNSWSRPVNRLFEDMWNRADNLKI